MERFACKAKRQAEGLGFGCSRTSRPPSFSTEATLAAFMPWKETAHFSKICSECARGGTLIPKPLKPRGSSYVWSTAT